MKHSHMLWFCGGLMVLAVVFAIAGAGAFAFLVPLGCVLMMGMMGWITIRGVSDGGWHWGVEREETLSEILERRFAEGAISVEDFRQRREVIAGVARDDQAAGDT
jgi:hypothetical protein